MSFCNKRLIKSTRKACRCYWCGEIIPAGASKIYVSTVWEGDFWTGGYHKECDTACEEWFKKYRGEEHPDEGSMKRGKIEER